MAEKRVEDYILTIPDFPHEGIMFRDITTVMQDADGFRLAIDSLLKALDGVEFDVVVGVESRGFLFGAPLSYELHKPFVPVRKKGKLPRQTVSCCYELEYDTAEIEMHTDSIQPGQKVVLIDDLLATGGTVKAAASLIEQLGGEVVRMLFLVELKGLDGRLHLDGYTVDSIVKYEGK